MVPQEHFQTTLNKSNDIGKKGAGELVLIIPRDLEGIVGSHSH